MPRITSLEELNRLKVELVMKRNQEAYRGVTHVTVGMGSCGVAAGAREVYEALEAEVKRQGLSNVLLSQVGCVGLCRHEPIVEVTTADATRVSYGRVDVALVKRIIQEHILDGRVVEEAVIDATPFPTI